MIYGLGADIPPSAGASAAAGAFVGGVFGLVLSGWTAAAAWQRRWPPIEEDDDG